MTDKKEYYVPKGSPVFPSRFDTRVRLRSLTLGLLNQEELDAHLEALPDESANAEFIDFNSIVEGDDVEETAGHPAAEEVTAQDAAFGVAETTSDAGQMAQGRAEASQESLNQAEAPQQASEIPGSEIAPPLSEEDVPKAHESIIPKVIPPASSPTDDSDFN